MESAAVCTFVLALYVMKTLLPYNVVASCGHLFSCEVNSSVDRDDARSFCSFLLNVTADCVNMCTRSVN
jgi:hypothetical protein